MGQENISWRRPGEHGVGGGGGDGGKASMTQHFSMMPKAPVSGAYSTGHRGLTADQNRCSQGHCGPGGGLLSPRRCQLLR